MDSVKALGAGDIDPVEKKEFARKKTFPEILKYQRELRGWSQAKLSETIGATPNRISMWERGMALPGAYFREKLCSCLGMDAQELGLLAVDAEAQPSVDMPIEAQMFVYPSVILDPPDILQTLPAQTSSRSYRFVVCKRVYWISLLTVLVVALLLIGGSFYGLFDGVFNPSQTNSYPPHTGRLVLNDALRDQTGGVNWQEGVNNTLASCIFKEGGYVAFQPTTGLFHACVAQTTDYTNFTYEVSMTVLQGEFGGIVFRAEDSGDAHYYLFRVHTDGSYWLYRFAGLDIGDATLLDYGSAQVFNKGLGKKNRLAVVAQGSLLTLYINSQDVTSLQDAGYTHGQIGVLAGSINHGPGQALFQDAKVWK